MYMHKGTIATRSSVSRLYKYSQMSVAPRCFHLLAPLQAPSNPTGSKIMFSFSSALEDKKAERRSMNTRIVEDSLSSALSSTLQLQAVAALSDKGQIDEDEELLNMALQKAMDTQLGGTVKKKKRRDEPKDMGAVKPPTMPLPPTKTNNVDMITPMKFTEELAALEENQVLSYLKQYDDKIYRDKRIFTSTVDRLVSLYDGSNFASPPVPVDTALIKTVFLGSRDKSFKLLELFDLDMLVKIPKLMSLTGVVDLVLIQNIQTRLSIKQLMTDLSPSDLATVATSFARIRLPKGKVAPVFSRMQEVLGEIDLASVSPPDVAVILESYSQAGFHDSPIFDLLGRHLVAVNFRKTYDEETINRIYRAIDSARRSNLIDNDYVALSLPESDAWANVERETRGIDEEEDILRRYRWRKAMENSVSIDSLLNVWFDRMGSHKGVKSVNLFYRMSDFCHLDATIGSANRLHLLRETFQLIIEDMGILRKNDLLNVIRAINTSQIGGYSLLNAISRKVVDLKYGFTPEEIVSLLAPYRIYDETVFVRMGIGKLFDRLAASLKTRNLSAMQPATMLSILDAYSASHARRDTKVMVFELMEKHVVRNGSRMDFTANDIARLLDLYSHMHTRQLALVEHFAQLVGGGDVKCSSAEIQSFLNSYETVKLGRDSACGEGGMEIVVMLNDKLREVKEREAKEGEAKGGVTELKSDLLSNLPTKLLTVDDTPFTREECIKLINRKSLKIDDSFRFFKSLLTLSSPPSRDDIQVIQKLFLKTSDLVGFTKRRDVLPIMFRYTIDLYEKHWVLPTDDILRRRAELVLLDAIIDKYSKLELQHVDPRFLDEAMTMLMRVGLRDSHMFQIAADAYQQGDILYRKLGLARVLGQWVSISHLPEPSDVKKQHMESVARYLTTLPLSEFIRLDPKRCAQAYRFISYYVVDCGGEEGRVFSLLERLQACSSKNISVFDWRSLYGVLCAISLIAPFTPSHNYIHMLDRIDEYFEKVDPLLMFTELTTRFRLCLVYERLQRLDSPVYIGLKDNIFQSELELESSFRGKSAQELLSEFEDGDFKGLETASDSSAAVGRFQRIMLYLQDSASSPLDDLEALKSTKLYATILEGVKENKNSFIGGTLMAQVKFAEKHGVIDETMFSALNDSIGHNADFSKFSQSTVVIAVKANVERGQWDAPLFNALESRWYKVVDRLCANTVALLLEGFSTRRPYSSLFDAVERRMFATNDVDDKGKTYLNMRESQSISVLKKIVVAFYRCGRKDSEIFDVVDRLLVTGVDIASRRDSNFDLNFSDIMCILNVFALLGKTNSPAFDLAEGMFLRGDANIESISNTAAISLLDSYAMCGKNNSPLFAALDSVCYRRLLGRSIRSGGEVEGLARVFSNSATKSEFISATEKQKYDSA